MKKFPFWAKLQHGNNGLNLSTEFGPCFTAGSLTSCWVFFININNERFSYTWCLSSIPSLRMSKDLKMHFSSHMGRSEIRSPLHPPEYPTHSCGWLLRLWGAFPFFNHSQGKCKPGTIHLLLPTGVGMVVGPVLVLPLMKLWFSPFSSPASDVFNLLMGRGWSLKPLMVYSLCPLYANSQLSVVGHSIALLVKDRMASHAGPFSPSSQIDTDIPKHLGSLQSWIQTCENTST